MCFQVFSGVFRSYPQKNETRKQLNIWTTVWGRCVYNMWYTVAEFTTLLLLYLRLVHSGSQPKQTFQKFRLDKPVRAQRGRWQQLRERAGLWNVAGLVWSNIIIKGRRCWRHQPQHQTHIIVFCTWSMWSKMTHSLAQYFQVCNLYGFSIWSFPTGWIRQLYSYSAFGRIYMYSGIIVLSCSS